MNLLKVLLALAVLALAVFGAFALFGLVAALLKYVILFGLIALVGVGAYKLLSKPSRPEYGELTDADIEMLKTERLLEEMRRKQLMK